MTQKQNLSVAVTMVISFLAVSVFGQTDSTFSYQGELRDGGTLANGTYNIDFSLWDAASGGNQVGGFLMIDNVPVTDGRFTVELDFGVAAFNNSDRFIEIEVQGVTLSPRQPITRTPYAIQTRGMFVDANENVGIGITSPKAPLHVNGDYYGSGHLFLHAQEGDGANGTAYVQARDDSGSSSINLRLRTQLNGQIMNTMTLSSIGRVGIGTTAPLSALHVANPFPILNLQDVDGAGSTQSGYVSLRNAGGTEEGWMGYGSQLNTDLTIANDIGDVVLFSNGFRATLQTNGRFGVGTNVPSARFQVKGDSFGFDSPFNHLVLFEDDEPTSPGILALKTNMLDNPCFHQIQYVTFYDTDNEQMGTIRGGTGLPCLANGQASVAYTSGAGDFAEHMPLLDPTELIEPGDVVAEWGGAITRNTSEARRVMVVSSSPAFVGNEHKGTSGDDHRMVAFVGQVPVRVRGPVDAGDFLVASGQNDGTALAVAPDNLSIEQLPLVAATAWETDRSHGVKTVMAAVGIDQAAAAHEVAFRLEERLRVSETRIADQQVLIDEISMRMETLARQISDANGRDAMR